MSVALVADRDAGARGGHRGRRLDPRRRGARRAPRARGRRGRRGDRAGRRAPARAGRDPRRAGPPDRPPAPARPRARRPLSAAAARRDGPRRAAACGMPAGCRPASRTPPRSSRRSPPSASSAPRSSAPWPRSPCPGSFAAGEAVFREGDASSTCYIVRSGHARAIREHLDGRQLTLATFGPGEIFGELAMFDDELRSATVEAIDELEALAILGARHAAADARARRDRGQAGGGARAPPARHQRAARAAVVPDRPEPRRGGARPARRAGAARGRRSGRTSRSRRRRPTSRSSPAPRASRPAASSPCSSGRASSRRAAAA